MGNQNTNSNSNADQTPPSENLTSEQIKERRIKKMEEEAQKNQEMPNPQETKPDLDIPPSKKFEDKKEPIIEQQANIKKPIAPPLENLNISPSPIEQKISINKNSELMNVFKINLFQEKNQKKSGSINILFKEGFTMESENFDSVIDKILCSPLNEHFPLPEDKINYLFESYASLNSSNFLKNVEKFPLKKKVWSYLISLLLTPMIYNIEGPDFNENMNDLFSLTCRLKTRFYNCLLIEDPDIIDEFLTNLTTEFNEIDVSELIESVFKRILSDCSKDYNLEVLKPILLALNLLNKIIDNKKIQNFFCQKSITFANKDLIRNGLYLQKLTIFGAALCISSLPDDNKTWETYFKSATSQGKRVVDKNIEVLRQKINEVNDLLFKIIDKLLRSNPENKKKVLEFFYFVIEMNKDKTKMYNMGTCSKASLLLNLMKIAFKLCGPFIDDIEKIMSKIAKVDIDYFDCPEKNQFFQGMEPFNADYLKENADKIIKKEAESFNFVTEIFFLTTYLIHLNQSSFKNYLNFLIKVANESKIDPKSPNFAMLLGYKCAFDIMLMDPFILEKVVKTFSFISILSLNELQVFFNLESFINYSKITQITEKFSKLPLFIAEDMYEYLLVLRQCSPESLKKHEFYLKITSNFMLIVMGHRNLINNPHIRAKFLIFLSIICKRNTDGHGEEVDFKSFFVNNNICEDHLIKSLIEIFIDVEKTGSSNQFYEKFSYRYHFCQLMGFLINFNPANRNSKESYSSKLQEFAETNQEKMIQFYNLFLNDVIYLLDESLSKLKEIKIYEENEANTINLPFQEQMEKKQIFEQNKKLAKTFLDFLNSYYENIKFMSSFVSKILLSEALREKIVFNLNYTIEALNGKNALDLKIKNMKQMNFDPKFILKCIIEVYLNLSDYEEFLETVVKDERSYSEETFEKTKCILVKYNLIIGDEVSKFEYFLNKLKVLNAKQKKNEDLFADLPEKYLDPIMNEVMKDPVLLPTSGVIVDRMTIIKHLLSDNSDPFNRKPLTKEMIVGQTELKEEIEEFLRKKKINMK